MTHSEGDSKPRRANRRVAERAGIDTLRKGLDWLQQGRKVAQQAGCVLTVAGAVRVAWNNTSRVQHKRTPGRSLTQ
jgi:hypothetical protein